MLFTDADPITVKDLAGVDPEIIKIAQSQTPIITLSGEDSVIRNAIDECGNIITTNWQNFSGYLVSPGININHVAAVLNILSTAINRPRFRLNQLITIEPDSTKRMVKRWMLYKSLEMFYQAAFARFTKDKDRFEFKMEHYINKGDEAFERLKSSGLPIVLQPLPCPGAIREYQAGVFDSDNVSVGGTGSTDPGQTWYIVITWMAISYLDQQLAPNNESGQSATINTTTSSGQVITVNLNGLNPPINPPPIGTADGIYTALVPDHWNIYMSSDPNGPFYLQNPSPIPLATTSYTLPNMPIKSQVVVSSQSPDYNFSYQAMVFRS